MTIGSDIDFAISEKDFSFVADVVRRKTGIVIRDGKMAMVRGRLARRARVLKLENLSQYCELLRTNDDEFQGLVNAITTNHTFFFRERHHFDYLQSHIMPEIVRSDSRRIRVWSAACSSGEEAYCISAIAEQFHGGLFGKDFKILATDIDTDMLAKARDGKYSSDDLNGAPDDLTALLNPVYDGNMVLMPQKLRDRITFRALNLLDPWPFSGLFDVIFCRNVMIYFDVQTKERLIERFVSQLHPGGYLCIGHSESLHGAHVNLSLIGRTIYRKI